MDVDFRVKKITQKFRGVVLDIEKSNECFYAEVDDANNDPGYSYYAQIFFNEISKKGYPDLKVGARFNWYLTEQDSVVFIHKPLQIN